MKAYAITDIGKKRSFNQDYAWMTTDEIGKLPNLFIVADGMGGHRGGGYASRLAVETILEQIRQSQAESPAPYILIPHSPVHLHLTLEVIIKICICAIAILFSIQTILQRNTKRNCFETAV